MSLLKWAKIVSAGSLMVASPFSAHAILFDSNGAAPGGVINDVQSFDWSPGNAIAIDGANRAPGETFQLLAHSSLGNFLDSNGATITSNNNLNTAYEVTFVASFQEQLATAGVFPGAASFITTGAGPNFFEIWIDAVNSNQLAGTGFNNGTLIASGQIQAGGLGSFTTGFNNAPTGVPLDQFGVDNYPDINTVSPGAGGTILEVIVSFGFYDTDYFVDGIGDLTFSFNTSQVLPYQETNPSALFTDMAGGAAPSQAGATLGSVGPINGLIGPNVMFQADANSSVTQVPEPGPLALMTFGLVGLLGFASRRRN